MNHTNSHHTKLLNVLARHALNTAPDIATSSDRYLERVLKKFARPEVEGYDPTVADLRAAIIVADAGGNELTFELMNGVKL